MFRSLSQKLFLYFLIVITLSLLTVGIFIYRQSSVALDKQAEKYIAQIIDNASYQSDLYLQTYERVSSSILYNADIKRFLDMEPEDFYQHYLFHSKIRDGILAPTFITYPQINLIYIIGDHGKAIVHNNQGLSIVNQFEPLERLALMNRLTPDNGSMAILNQSVGVDGVEDTITIARKIRGASSHEPNGVLAIEIRSQELAQLWDRVDLGSSGFFFVLDESREVIYYPEDVQLKSSLSEGDTERIVHSDNHSFASEVNGEKRMFVTRTSDYSGWKLVVSMSLDELRAPISTIRTTTLMVGLLTLIAALWLAYRFGKSIVTPIRRLKDGMRETEKGNWKSVVVKERHDEIGGLIHSYNLMVSRLSEMIEQVYEGELKNQKTVLELQDIELERQRAEFQALQLQINPHFLYNTLETINCYAIVQDSEEINEMVEAMAYMLRYSTQTNIEEITVANELNHVRNYLIILKHRIGWEFEIDVIVPPSLLLEKMVRLTLQPLIENIFQHAFPEGIDSDHFIRINARKQDDLFQVIVEDNGVGIEQQKLLDLNDQLKLNRLAETPRSTVVHGGGIGLMNVHRRIQMVYGEEYGLSIESKLGLGTTMIMSMPLEWKKKL